MFLELHERSTEGEVKRALEDLLRRGGSRSLSLPGPLLHYVPELSSYDPAAQAAATNNDPDLINKEMHIACIVNGLPETVEVVITGSLVWAVSDAMLTTALDSSDRTIRCIRPLGVSSLSCSR